MLKLVEIYRSLDNTHATCRKGIFYAHSRLRGPKNPLPFAKLNSHIYDSMTYACDSDQESQAYPDTYKSPYTDTDSHLTETHIHTHTHTHTHTHADKHQRT